MKSQIKAHPVFRRLTRQKGVWWLVVQARSLLSRLTGQPEQYPIVDDRHLVEMTTPIVLDWGTSPKPRVGLVRDILAPPWWSRFERFLRANDLPWEWYDIHRSDWMKQAGKFDVVVWRPISFPAGLEEARRKIWLLENQLGKLCYPDHKTLLLYEDKIMQYEQLQSHGLPVIPTFVSHSYDEAMAATDSLMYPLVSKIVTGSGSIGVDLVRTPQQARKIVRQAFSYSGRWTGWPYQRQKDYIFFQKYQPNAGYDLRIFVAGNHLNGFYRDVPEGEFRASGMALLREGELPEAAMRLALEVARKLELITVAVDMLYTPAEDAWHIIEIAAFTTMHRIPYNREGNPGSFVPDGQGGFRFQPERYWLQETTLEAFFRRFWLS